MVDTMFTHFYDEGLCYPNRYPVRESVTFASPMRHSDGGSEEKTFQFTYRQAAFP